MVYTFGTEFRRTVRVCVCVCVLPGRLMKVLRGGELLSEMVKGTVYTSGGRYGVFRDRFVCVSATKGTHSHLLLCTSKATRVSKCVCVCV